ncbi:gamma-glutamylcyclotransferase [Nitratiruptor sp. YY09-18]|uniref:gamma-glutamylcyclotransferase family protein n=1 Tax=Nitratiruptor sp. YY09-18 TaxID=2724901 RepID=UPI0019152688|nr:gamma-glutamylcyclotransferase family protein [Nitratiruptor sp. YY09-18]BCD67584.1 gamma-glutamylaminecyclotransferase [Nitratiruptor sp. YY09-18]
MCSKLFVYGTLKRGLCNHHYLQGAKFFGEATTTKAYPLIAPRIWYPYLIDAPGYGKKVKGELYKITPRILQQIDLLEEYPYYYNRKIIDIVDTQGRLHRAWCYFYNEDIVFTQWEYLEEFRG